MYHMWPWRSARGSIQFHLIFRNFSLHLLPHDGIFANHFEALVEDRDGNRHIHTDFDPSEFYIGYVEGWVCHIDFRKEKKYDELRL